MNDSKSRLQRLQEAQSVVNNILLGKDHQVNLAFCCLLARGHLLIEDVPGVGKTTLAHAMARVIGSEYQRIQFTSDLLPADILGVSVYNSKDASFSFHPGPIFTQLLLADEINRAPAKTQSALLQAMQESRVSIAGAYHALPQPFHVLATQNPIEQEGTYPLPEAQLDRFLLKIDVGYPDLDTERRILIDCGLFQGSKTVRKLNYGEFPFKADEIDFVLLTHAPFARWTLICAVSGRTSDLLSG